MEPVRFSNLFSNGADDVDAGRKQETSCPARVTAYINFPPKDDNSHTLSLTGPDHLITGGRCIPSSLSVFGTTPTAPAPLFGARDGNTIFPIGKEKAIANIYNCFFCQGRGTRDLCYTPTIEADTNDRIMSISAKPEASNLSVEELRWQYCQAHKTEPPNQGFSFGGSASGDNSNNKGPLPGAPFPLWGSAFGPSNGSTSKSITNSGKHDKSQVPTFTFPAVFSPLGGPGSDSSTSDALLTPGFPGTKPGNTGLFDNAPPNPLFSFPRTRPGNTGLFENAPPTPLFGFPETRPGNTGLFHTPGWFPPKDGNKNNATPTDHFPGFPPAQTSQPTPPSPFTFKPATERDAWKTNDPGFPPAQTSQPTPPSPFTFKPATERDEWKTNDPGFPPAQTSQPTPPSPFTFKPATERDAWKPLFSTGIERHVGNSQRDKECGRHAPEEKHGPFDSHVPVLTTMQAPTQLQQGDCRVCSKPTNEDAERVGNGSIIAPSGLPPAIPVMMLPVIPTFNGAFGVVPGNTGPGYIPGSYMYPGTTIPPFMVPHNLLGTQTASEENATPFVYMQPVPFASANSLAQMFSRMYK